MDAISLQAAAIRGLTNRDSFERHLVSSEELRQIIEEGFAEDAEDVEIADRLYTILSIIEPDSALSAILLDVYSNIVVGLFDTDENVLYVLAEGDEFTASNELTVAHEVAHGLQQQHFNIKDIGDAYEDNSDRQSAIRALIEGDATLVELIYRLRVFDDRQRQLHMEESQAADLSAFRAAPPFIQRTVAFPYFEGANFAISMYQLTGDFSIIDGAYEVLPESTEQILHPELLGQDSPIEIALPDLVSTLGDGWSEVDRDVMGELFMAALLEGVLDVSVAGQAAAGWGGDAFLLLEDPAGSEALVSISEWDSVEDSDEFYSALMQYFQGLTEDEEWTEQEAADGATAHRIAAKGMAVEVRSESGRVWLTVAADPDTIDDIVAELLASADGMGGVESGATSTAP